VAQIDPTLPRYGTGLHEHDPPSCDVQIDVGKLFGIHTVCFARLCDELCIAAIAAGGFETKQRRSIVLVLFSVVVVGNGIWEKAAFVETKWSSCLVDWFEGFDLFAGNSPQFFELPRRNQDPCFQ
jgi:hypothetical protein